MNQPAPLTITISHPGNYIAEASIGYTVDNTRRQFSFHNMTSPDVKSETLRPDATDIRISVLCRTGLVWNSKIVIKEVVAAAPRSIKLTLSGTTLAPHCYEE